MIQKNKENNLFEEVLIASHRAKQLSHGHSPMIETGTTKNTVVALAELKQGYINSSILDQHVELAQSVDDILSQAYSEDQGNTQ